MYGVWNAMEDLVRRQEAAQWDLERTKRDHPTESHHVMARVAHFQGLEREFIPGTDQRLHSSVGFGENRRDGHQEHSRSCHLRSGRPGPDDRCAPTTELRRPRP
jgi:hypothetical protein